MEVLPQSQVALGGLDGDMAEADLDLLERRAAEVGELGEGAPQVVRGDLSQPGPPPASKTPCGVSGEGPTRPPFETLRSTEPEEIPAAVAQRSSASFAQERVVCGRGRNTTLSVSALEVNRHPANGILRSS